MCCDQPCASRHGYGKLKTSNLSLLLPPVWCGRILHTGCCPSGLLYQVTSFQVKSLCYQLSSSFLLKINWSLILESHNWAGCLSCDPPGLQWPNGPWGQSLLLASTVSSCRWKMLLKIMIISAFPVLSDNMACFLVFIWHCAHPKATFVNLIPKQVIKLGKAGVWSNPCNWARNFASLNIESYSRF